MKKLLAALLLAPGCTAAAPFGDTGDPAPSPSGARAIEFSPQITGGFDDWSSPGAAVGYAVDEDRQLTLVVAMAFDLPAYEVALAPGSDPSETLGSYPARVPDVLADDAAALPILAAALTDSAGARGMGPDFSAFLLAGDPSSPEPERVYVAYAGAASLTRLDDPADWLEGSLAFQEFGSMGSPEPSAGAEAVAIEGLSFSWGTAEQP